MRVGLKRSHDHIRATPPPKWGRFPPETMYFLCIVTCLNVSAMYLECIFPLYLVHSDVLYRCIVYVSSVHSHVSSVHSHVSLLCLVPSFMLL